MMNRKKIRDAYDLIRPSYEQKERMLDTILNASSARTPGGKDVSMKNNKRKLLFVAAMIAVSLLLVGCAAVVFGLRDLSMGEYVYQAPTQPGETTAETQSRTVLSLQGFAGSNSYLASKEWYEFESAYDPDLKILQSLEDDSPKYGDDYIAYNCYTQEMCDKIDEICEKYNVQPLGRLWSEPTAEEAFAALGIDGILNPDVPMDAKLLSNYYFQGGTFQVEGDITMTGEDALWTNTVGFSLRCSMKDTLDYVHIHLRDVESYEHWNYTTKDGTELLLALSPNGGAMIFADSPSHFTAITTQDALYRDRHGEEVMVKEGLEALAECFVYDFEPQEVDTESAQQRYEEQMAEQDAQWAVSLEELAQLEGRYSYEGRVRAALENYDDPENCGYALRDLDGDGSPELLLGEDGGFHAIYTMVDGEAKMPFLSDGTGRFYVCEDNIVVTISAYDPYYMVCFWAMKLENGEAVVLDGVTYTPKNTFNETPRWGRWTGHNSPGIEITQEEYEKTLAKYKRVFIETEPLTSYPITEEVNRTEYEGFSYDSYEDLMWQEIEYGHHLETAAYALWDHDGNGVQELLLVDELTGQQLYTLENGKTREVEWLSWGVKFYENGVIGIERIFYDGLKSYSYYKLEGHKLTLVDYLRYDPAQDAEHQWQRSVYGNSQDKSCQPISEEQAQAVMASFREIELEWKPLSEFPVN